MISLCMIVKNEELNLRGCLSAAAPLVDEIVVIDTGSTDNTKLIAREFSSKVYDFKWCNDFAKARNFSISKANNDWILILDADEYVSHFSKESIENFVSDISNIKRVGRLKRINIMEDNLGIKRYHERVNRLFNRRSFCYEGIIHEQVVNLFNNPYDMFNVDIIAHHIGYTKEVLNRTDKLNRNIELLYKAIEDSPNDPYMLYQSGKSYYMLREYNRAAYFLERALNNYLDYRLEYVSDLVESYGYCLVNCGRYKDALQLERYSGIYKESPDWHFLMGVVYMNNAQFTQAVESFLKCTDFDSGKVEGITTYLPNYNIGVIFEVLGFKEKAYEYYRLCGEYDLAVNRLR